MSTPRMLPARQVIVGLVAASALAAGLTLGIEHATGGPAVNLQSAAVAAGSPSPSPTPKERPEFGHGGFGGVSAGAVIGIFTRDTGVGIPQLITDVQAGRTLDEIAGTNAAKVKADYLAAITTGLDQAVTKGVITRDSEQHLIADARDAIDQLFLANLSKAGLGMPGLGFPGGFGFPGGGDHHARPLPSASPATSGA